LGDSLTSQGSGHHVEVRQSSRREPLVREVHAQL
jgi:hypothetical protein